MDTGQSSAKDLMESKIPAKFVHFAENEPADEEVMRALNDLASNEPSAETDASVAIEHPKPKAKSIPRTSKKKKIAQEALFTEIDELITSDYIGTAQINASMAPALVSKDKDKTRVMKELVASVSDAEKPAARLDAARLIDASRKYHGLAKHTEGTWKVKGLKTGLYHHQLEAGAWIIDREQSNDEPYGGMLCHEMGLGKTLTMLSVVVNQRLKTTSEAPTLVVVPSNLVTYWLEEIDTHCEQPVVHISHYAGSRQKLRDMKGYFLRHHIVITTYNEVIASYPSTKYPKTALTEQEYEEWWNSHRGDLHDIRWHRIILDEAHNIRNKDKVTSRAVRALMGNHKWAVTGTPLLNHVREIYPYLEFIGAPGCSNFRDFGVNYFDGAEQTKCRLKDLLRTVMHRKTNKNRYFGAPLIVLPNIVENRQKAEFSRAESRIEWAIRKCFVSKVNALISDKAQQKVCILVLIQRHRMYASHLLAAQDIVEAVLDDETMEFLESLTNEETEKDGSSATIARLLMDVVDWKPRILSDRPKPPEDKNLMEKFQILVNDLIKKELWYELLEHETCACCSPDKPAPPKFFLTSCHHRYCEECFETLADEHGNIDTAERQCYLCQKNVTSILFCKEALETDTLSPDNEPSEPQPRNKGNAPSTNDSEQNIRSKKRRGTKQKKNKRTFSGWLETSESVGKEERFLNAHYDPDKDSEPASESYLDWISEVGERMPGAKLTAIENKIKSWIDEDEDVKIVVFTEFRATVQLLTFMCKRNGWEYGLMHGGIASEAREKEVLRFRNEQEIKILIATMKTGGIGLNLTMANKCIVCDQWWNEAIERQAYCRLHRNGQKREVEYVKFTVNHSIDDWILSLQQRKSAEINQYIPSKDIQDGALIDILSFYGFVTRAPGDGGFLITPREETTLP